VRVLAEGAEGGGGARVREIALALLTRCVMRLASANTMDATLEPPYHASVSVNFIEASSHSV
jgi:hypothetical protein